MAFATNLARAKSRGHDIRRNLFLKRNAVGEQGPLRIYGPNGQLGEVRRGWNLGLNEQIEIKTGERYFSLFIDLVDDPDGDLLAALKQMTKVRINSTEFMFLTKPTFLNEVPSYTFKVQPITQV
jgi:hypothetical protein